MKRVLLLILTFSLLTATAACQPKTTAAPTPSLTPPPKTPTPSPAPTSTTTLSYTECGWNWATQPLPELSAELESALQESIQLPLEAHAEAFGEHCFDGRTNEVAYFVARETDFYITVHAEALDDREALGRLTEQILLVLLSHFPVEATPGPQPGYLSINFVTDIGELRLRFGWFDAESALGSGLHGASLLEALESR